MGDGGLSIAAASGGRRVSSVDLYRTRSNFAMDLTRPRRSRVAARAGHRARWADELQRREFEPLSRSELPEAFLPVPRLTAVVRNGENPDVGGCLEIYDVVWKASYRTAANW